MLCACEGDNPELVKLLINSGADVNHKNEYRYNALMKAFEASKLDIIKLLIDAGAGIDTGSDTDIWFNNYTPLMLACIYGYRDVVEIILKKNPNIETQNKKGNSALIIATNNNYKSIARLLIEKDANVNIENQFGDTPLIFACCENSTEIVRLLIEKGANVNVVTKAGDTPLTYACYQNNTEIERLLIEKGAKRPVVKKSNSSKDKCSVCNKSKSSIGEQIRKMQSLDISVISHDVIAFCEKCNVSFCSDHFDTDYYPKTIKCRRCGSNLKVEHDGYMP